MDCIATQELIKERMGKKRERLRSVTAKNKSLRVDENGVKSLNEKEGNSEDVRDLQESSSNESNAEEDDSQITLDAKPGSESVEMTFEFNDMKEPYSDGVARMLEFFLPSYESRQTGRVIADQGFRTCLFCKSLSSF